MKRIAAVTLILAAGFITAGSALAQNRKVTADIPFNFSLDGQSLPAGHYTIEADSRNPDVLMIENRDDSVHLAALALPGAPESQRNNTIAFHRYGDQYFLSTIHANDVAVNCHLAISKQEKWVKPLKQNAALRVNDDVLIALK